jgi:hypothetical protein
MVVNLTARATYFEKRRKVMGDWATFCAQPAPAGDDVRSMRAVD